MAVGGMSTRSSGTRRRMKAVKVLELGPGQTW